MPKARRVWSGPALADLRAIRAYVTQENRIAARRLGAQIKKAALQLRDHPETGRVVPELSGHAYRELVVAPYRIVHDVRRREVVILRVWHGRREIDQ